MKKLNYTFKFSLLVLLSLVPVSFFFCAKGTERKKLPMRATIPLPLMPLFTLLICSGAPGQTKKEITHSMIFPGQRYTFSFHALVSNHW